MKKNWGLVLKLENSPGFEQHEHFFYMIHNIIMYLHNQVNELKYAYTALTMNGR